MCTPFDATAHYWIKRLHPNSEKWKNKYTAASPTPPLAHTLAEKNEVEGLIEIRLLGPSAESSACPRV